jgi:hypothetical protein
MTTKNQKRMQYLGNISSYLLDLGVLANKTITRDDLSSLEKLDEVRSKVSNIENLPIKKFEIEFSEKYSIRFNDYIKALYAVNNRQVYPWLDRTSQCGLYTFDSIKDVDFSFPFDFDGEIVSFSSVDLKDTLLLDSFVDDFTGKEMIEIKTQGLNWPNVKY